MLERRCVKLSKKLLVTCCHRSLVTVVTGRCDHWSLWSLVIEITVVTGKTKLEKRIDLSNI